MKKSIFTFIVNFILIFCFTHFQFGANVSAKVSQFLNGLQQAKSKALVLDLFKKNIFSDVEIEIVKNEIKKQGISSIMEKLQIKYEFECVQFETEERCVKTEPVCVKKNAYGACIEYKPKCVQTETINICKKWVLKAV
jgi:hypothetical protein